MENQNDQPKSMEKSSRKGTLKLKQIEGGGGAIVIVATIITAAIAAAFVAHRAKRCTKKDDQRNQSHGVDENALQNLQEKFVDKHEASDETIKNKFECKSDDEEIEKEKEESDGTSTDSSTESSGGAVWPSEIIDHRQFRKEEFAFGSLIEIQETDSEMIVNINKKQERYKGLAIDIGTVEKLAMEDNHYNGNNNSSAANDFSFWNDKLNKQEDAMDVIKEASEVSDRTDDIFEFEGQEEHDHVEVVKLEEDKEEYDGIVGKEDGGKKDGEEDKKKNEIDDVQFEEQHGDDI